MISPDTTTNITHSTVIDSFVEDGWDWMAVYEKAVRDGDNETASLALKNIETARTSWMSA